MSEIIQANCSWSKTSGETDLGWNVWTQDNSPHNKLTQKQFAPASEINSPHVVILHNVLKYVVSFEDKPLIHQSILSAFVLEIIGSAKNKTH